MWFNQMPDVLMTGPDGRDVRLTAADLADVMDCEPISILSAIDFARRTCQRDGFQLFGEEIRWADAAAGRCFIGA